MSEQRKGLPENAQRELKPGEVYEPLLGADRKWAEITPYSVTVGLLMVVIFSAAAAYLGCAWDRSSRLRFRSRSSPWA